MYSIFRGAIKLLEVNVTLLRVDPQLSETKEFACLLCSVFWHCAFRGSGHVCSNIALFVENKSLRNICQFSRFTSAYVQPSHWTRCLWGRGRRLDWADGGSWLWKAFSSLESNVAALGRRAQDQSWVLQRRGVSSPSDSLRQREALLHNLVAMCLD